MVPSLLGRHHIFWGLFGPEPGAEEVNLALAGAIFPGVSAWPSGGI
jgi:hypothetical protein